MRFILLLVACAITGLTLAQPKHYRSSNGISDKKSYNRRAAQPYFLNLRCGLSQFYGELNAQAMHGIGGEKMDFFNSYFVNEYNSAECLVKWDLSEQFSEREPGPVHIAVYAGLGQIWFSANAFDLDNNKLLRFTNSGQSARNPLFLRWGTPKGPKGIKKTREGILPLGTSVDYALLAKLKITLEYRFYFVRTDKLDATSGRRLINPEESESYSETPNDAFSFIAVSLQYHLGQRKR
jgi:hypothetical protein